MRANRSGLRVASERRDEVRKCEARISAHAL